MYPDLHAAKNGSKPQYEIFNAANCVIENGSGATPTIMGRYESLQQLEPILLQLLLCIMRYANALMPAMMM